MKVFVGYIRDYFRTDFELMPHVWTASFLAVCIALNYSMDLYVYWTTELYRSPLSVLVLFTFFAAAFLITIAIVSWHRSENKPFRNRAFVIFGLTGILFLSLDSSYYLMQFVENLYHRNASLYLWEHSCFSNLSSFVSVIVPCFAVYFLTKQFKPEWYGLRLNGARILPYFWLILFMIPLIYLASLRPDFLETYPSYTDYYEYRVLQIDQWLTAGIYELTYGFDFLSVELFFRGFMVVGLSRLAGKDVLLPMVTVYCFLHFGKPLGEAVSSIFGGYILGILAFQSRNIFGGLVAHLGVAWGMELLAWVQLN